MRGAGAARVYRLRLEPFERLERRVEPPPDLRLDVRELPELLLDLRERLVSPA
jgi:hypothetical protein